ncbi:hypothetical protein ACFYP6_22405 [Streptomyces goshikiensis]
MPKPAWIKVRGMATDTDTATGTGTGTGTGTTGEVAQVGSGVTYLDADPT